MTSESQDTFCHPHYTTNPTDFPTVGTNLMANMGPTWGQQDPGGTHVGPMKLAIWVAELWKHVLNILVSTPEWLKCIGIQDFLWLLPTDLLKGALDKIR